MKTRNPCSCLHVTGLFYLFLQSFRYPADPKFRVYEPICEGRKVPAAEFEKGILDGLRKGKSFDPLCHPLGAYTVTVDTPDLLTVFLEVDIKHRPAEITHDP